MYIVLHLYYFLLIALFSFILLLAKQMRAWKPTATLPPGSMGWPYVGETMQLYSQNPNVLFSTRHNRYGEVFKTHILGSPCVMLSSPEAVRFVLVTQAHLFKPTYPQSKERLIGPSALFFHQDDYHGQIRRLVQGSLSLDVMRNLVPDIEAITISTLDSWSGNVVNTFYELKNARRRISLILGEIIKERKKRVWCIKIYWAQKTIFESNGGGNHLLSWSQTRNMPLTSRQSFDSSSVLSFGNAMVAGYLIPNGWKVLPLFRNIHHNPEIFVDPHKFDPSRFELGVKPNTFIPFGNGLHTYPGNEVAKLEVLIFIHHLVNKFSGKVPRWGVGVHYYPFQIPQQGLPAKFWKDSIRLRTTRPG
ncbi:abscisic acid 8'-hydroxylase 4-like [Pyrus ussuriensis x Pyrus communis]|uniref:Abscisic acid 8'-hydroxylase 4-like n=1 Tax=Pyrus ussuriensis x Pyrus communis TaxID=2448454 RepID=A0A5N5GXK6_9ROSA|nr:abscisic acid 8'-hydroxylase 4-like [Pyrus ussuriensis x Pyrus communis]